MPPKRNPCLVTRLPSSRAEFCNRTAEPARLRHARAGARFVFDDPFFRAWVALATADDVQPVPAG